MFVDAADPPARSAVHLVFVGERIRDDYVEPVPAFSPAMRTPDGITVAPVADRILETKLSALGYAMVPRADGNGAELWTASSPSSDPFLSAVNHPYSRP